MDPITALALFEALQSKMKGGKESPQNFLNRAAPAGSAIGGLVSNTATTEDGNINIGQASIGGGLQGLSAGSAFGPLGAILGGLTGATAGFATSSNQKIAYEEEQRKQREQKIINSTVEPFGGYYPEGGKVSVGSMLDLIAIQTELDEFMLLPDGSLVNTNAKSKHKDMDKDQVTDFVPESTIIFSEEKKFSPKKLSKEENFLGWGVQKYKEGEIGAEIERIELTDIIGDKKMSYSEAAKKVGKMYPVNNDNKGDVITEITNMENMVNRLDILKKLADMQDPIKDQGKFPGGTTSKGVSKIDDMFSNVLMDIEDLQNENFIDYNEGKKDYNRLNNGLKGSNAAFAAIQALSNLSQNPIEAAPIMNFNTAQFQGIPLSQIDNAVSQIRSNSDSIAQELINSGVDPKLVPSLVAGIESNSANVESDLRYKNLLDNVTRSNSKYAMLDQVRNQNNANITAAQNVTTTNINKRNSLVGGDIGNFIESNAQLNSKALDDKRSLEGQFNKSSLNLEASRREAQYRQSQFELLDQYFKNRLSQFDAGVAPQQKPPLSGILNNPQSNSTPLYFPNPNQQKSNIGFLTPNSNY